MCNHTILHYFNSISLVEKQSIKGGILRFQFIYSATNIACSYLTMLSYCESFIFSFVVYC